MEKKYELIPSDKKGLFRIKALRYFADVKKGDIGGYVQSEHNLSHYDDCWIYGDAMVYGNALVCDKAQVRWNARVYDDAWVYGKARVYGNAQVYGHAWVSGNAKVGGNAMVYDNAQVYDNARVYDNAQVCGNAQVCDNAMVHSDAVIKSQRDYIVFKNWWSSGRYFTWTRSNNMWSVGCFYGTGEELIKKAYKDSEESGMCYEKYVKFVEDLMKEN